MKRSLGEVGLVPARVVTVTSAGPAVPAGEVAVIWVPAWFTATLVAGFGPKSTVGLDPKPLPLIVTGVPPATGPLDGATDAMNAVGAYVTGPTR